MARSANLDFFAARDDQRALLDFLFLSTDVKVFESYSKFGSELREFTHPDEVSNAYPLGVDPTGAGYATLLQLWSPSVMAHPSIERITLEPTACSGHTFRHRISGAGLMQLSFGGVCGTVITMSHFGHQSQARAEKCGSVAGVNWDALSQVSGRIQYHLRKKLASGKVTGRPVLQEAMKLAQSGHLLKLSVKTPWQFELAPR